MAVTLNFSACSLQNNSEKASLSGDIEINTLAENIGKTKEEVFESLNIVEGEDVELSDKLPGAYILKTKQKFANEDFLLALTFDLKNGKMYGFMYIKDFENKPEEGYNLAKKLYDALKEEYGEPITYPLLPHRMLNMPSYEKIGSGDVSYYLETWKAEKDMSVTLRLTYVPDVGVRITIEYQI